MKAYIQGFIHGADNIPEHRSKAWIVGAVCDIQNARHVSGGRILHLLQKYKTSLAKEVKPNLFKQRFKVSAFCIPKVNLGQWSRVLSFLKLLVAFLTQHLIHLMSPLDDDPLDAILHKIVNISSITLSNSFFFIFNVCCCSL